jgi:hypothetical protein
MKLNIDIQHYLKLREYRVKNKMPISRIRKTDEIKHLTDRINKNIKIDDKIIVVGNEPEKPNIAIFKGYFKDDISGPFICEIGNEQWISFGTFCKFDEQLWEMLQSYEPIEIFNILALNRAYITEKYGVKYRHFREIYVTSDYDINDQDIKYEFHGELSNTAA